MPAGDTGVESRSRLIRDVNNDGRAGCFFLVDSHAQTKRQLKADNCADSDATLPLVSRRFGTAPLGGGMTNNCYQKTNGFAVSIRPSVAQQASVPQHTVAG